MNVAERLKHSFNKVIVVLVLSFPIIIFSNYHLNRQKSPRDDTHTYADFAYEVYKVSKSEGVLNGLIWGWKSNTYKPILHSTLASLGFSMSSGNYFLGIGIFNTILLLGLIYYLFYLSRMFLESRDSAFLVLLIIMQVWLLHSTSELYSELPFVLAGIATIFHLLKTEDWNNTKQVLFAAVWAGLSICIRPIEALGTMGLSIFILFFTKQKVNEGRDQSLKNIVLFIFISIGISIAWFYPTRIALYDWVYDCTVGKQAKEVHQSHHWTAASYIRFYFTNFGFTGFLLLFTAPLFQELKLEPLEKRKKKYVLHILLISILPSCLGLLTYNRDVRYYFLGWTVLVLAAGVLFLRKSGYCYQARRVLFYLFSIAAAISGSRLLIYGDQGIGLSIWGYRNGFAGYTQNEPSLEYYSFLKSVIKENNIRLIIEDLSGVEFVAEAARGEAIDVLALSDGLNWTTTAYVPNSVSRVDYLNEMSGAEPGGKTAHYLIFGVQKEKTQAKGQSYQLALDYIVREDSSILFKKFGIKKVSEKCSFDKQGYENCFYVYRTQVQN